ncbi:MAG: lipopolysaccharide biosynthesis protein [Sphingomonas sp.]|uniref:Wzz/FepE/Etk N-terminal domain-containing protein n=1 Tax=Sphingomonas sp. TaxID=28214 RepID=UPI001AD00617|nr:Wzz/FepE/Etk N-terminal domain-containing protein [Sphingomonas sp.]MBN8814165.1 lipopolysaccharide biosynthesis protein [Sphingomonas sp.]
MNDYYSGDDQSVVAASDGGFIAQLPSIVWQRRWFLIVPVLVAAIAALATAFLLPRVYDSTATLLVQSPSLPNDVIGTGNDADLINRRIESLRQQIVTRPKLLALIETNDLYSSDRARKPLSQVIDTMRDDITLTSIDANLNASKPEDRTIAFKLSFAYSDPTKAQAIAQSLMEQIVELNSTADVANANQAVQFLTEQGNNLKREISGLEEQIAKLNLQYGGVLARSNTPIGGNSVGYDMQIADLMRANQTLQLQKSDVATSDQRDPAVTAAEQALAAARAQYSEDHPDVRLAKARLAEAKRLATDSIKKVPVNNIDEQIKFNNEQIAKLRAAKAQEMSAVSATINSQSRAPAVQQLTLQLQQKLDGLYKQYDAISQRLMTAQAGARAANEQLGERLVVVDPPVVPDKPASPNRLLIIGGGIGAGLGLGVLLALLIEMFLQPVRTPGSISRITGSPTLALIPVIASSGDERPSLAERVFRNPFRRRPKEDQE